MRSLKITTATAAVLAILNINSFGQTVYEVQKGWNLAGAVSQFESSDFESAASFLWVYKNGSWNVVSPDGSKTDILANAGYTDTNLTVAQGIGFWIYSTNGGSVTVGENSSTSTEQNDTVLSYKIVDTGQVKCYDSNTGSETSCIGTGYDADYTGNEPSYTTNTEGTIVTDNITGLMWTKSSDLDGDGEFSDVDDKRDYDDASAYCTNLSLGGNDDWRLPDIKTLYSLIEFTGEDPSGYTGTDTSGLITFLDDSFDKAFGDQDAGERIIDGQYATTTKYVSTTMNNNETMFGVNFVDGRIKGYPIMTENDEKLFYVLCTRGNENYGENNFTDNGDDTVTDTATGLVWQKNDTQSSDFEDAVGSCEDAQTAGYSDWRLPSVKELQSIVDYSRSPDTTASAAIDPVFNASSFTNEKGETDWGYYWSSTTHATSGGGQSGSYVAFGRALGNMEGVILDVHGAGAQRSNSKMSESNDQLAESATASDGTAYYYKGPQGDILRIDNMVRCVRDMGDS